MHRRASDLAFEQIMKGAPVKKVLVMMPTLLEMLKNDDTRVECWSVFDANAETEQSYSLYVYKATERGTWEALGQLDGIETEDAAKARAAKILENPETVGEKMDMVKCPDCGGKVPTKSGYCLACKKKTVSEATTDVENIKSLDAAKAELKKRKIAFDKDEKHDELHAFYNKGKLVAEWIFIEKINVLSIQ